MFPQIVSMMNTIQLLWEKRYEQEDQLTHTELVIHQLEKNVAVLNVTNKLFRRKMRAFGPK